VVAAVLVGDQQLLQLVDLVEEALIPSLVGQLIQDKVLLEEVLLVMETVVGAEAVEPLHQALVEVRAAVAQQTQVEVVPGSPMDLPKVPWVY